MGIVGSLMGKGVAGGAVGAGQATSALGFEQFKQNALESRDATLAGYRQQEQERGFAHDEGMLTKREDVRQAGRQADINQDVSPANVEARANAVVRTSELTLPAEVAKKKALAVVDTEQKVDEFTKLAPLKRQEAIDTALANLKALSTPEALAASRKIALATHIVDPSYSAIPQADGTVVMFDSRSGKTSGILKTPDGEPVIRKDPEELKAATSVINMATGNLRIAQAEHKATMADPMADAPAKARANAEWQQAQAEAKRLTAPAYAVLFGKAGAEPASTTPPAGSGVDWSKFLGNNPKPGASANPPATPGVISQTRGTSALSQLTAQYERETGEISARTRRDYSPGLLEQIGTETAASRAPAQAEQASYAERERQRMLRDGRR